jgi:hypothetical protein
VLLSYQSHPWSLLMSCCSRGSTVTATFPRLNGLPIAC